MSKLQPVKLNVYNQQSTSLALASASQEDTAKAQSMSRAMLGGDNQRNAALPIQLRPKRTFGVATGEGKHLIPPAKRRKSIAPSTQRVVQPQVFGFEGNKHECRPVTQISCASTKRVTNMVPTPRTLVQSDTVDGCEDFTASQLKGNDISLEKIESNVSSKADDPERKTPEHSWE